MLTRLALLFYLSCVYAGSETIYFQESFPDKKSIDSWVSSTFNDDKQGSFEISAGDSPVDKDDFGLRTTTDNRFYGISKKLDKPFTNKDKTLVVQFTVKYDKSVSCGGAYLKLLGPDIDQTKFHGETPYRLMFGPDICGYSTKKVHVIFNYNGKNHLIKKEVRCKDDLKTHLYTLIVKPDNTYEVLIDNLKEESGSLEEDWDMLPPKKIDDPSAKKPDDWVDQEEIDDPDDKKPENWDQPKTIPDPSAKKPEDWDDEMDGEWERPTIDNPDYKGEWSPKKIPNPKYKGPWKAPQIDNPEYKPDSELYVMKDVAYIGFDLWQVTSGSIFDNILITDDPDYAKSQGEKVWKKRHDAEVEKEKEDEKKKKEEEKKESKPEEEEEKAEEEEKEDSETEKGEEKKAAEEKVGGDKAEESEEAEAKKAKEQPTQEAKKTEEVKETKPEEPAPSDKKEEKKEEPKKEPAEKLKEEPVKEPKKEPAKEPKKEPKEEPAKEPKKAEPKEDFVKQEL
ncbi:unnamed protein product [Calicophoron daubneyi]|uniref:Calreticulin n=1 Tax=Calicophoron daubneyi TaxID=300641 RepID=A0AAV2T8H6_CALDB